MDSSSVRGYRENYSALNCERVKCWGWRQQWGGWWGGWAGNVSRDQSVKGCVSYTTAGGGRAMIYFKYRKSIVNFAF